MTRNRMLIFAVVHTIGERLPGCMVEAFPVYSSKGTPTTEIVISVKVGERREVSENIEPEDDDVSAAFKAIQPALRLMKAEGQ